MSDVEFAKSCPTCHCLVAPARVADHDAWHTLDAAVDVSVQGIIEDFAVRLDALDGNEGFWPDDQPSPWMINVTGPPFTGHRAYDVFALAARIFGDPEQMAHWLTTRNPALDGDPPTIVMAAGHIDRVYDVLRSLTDTPRPDQSSNNTTQQGASNDH